MALCAFTDIATQRLTSRIRRYGHHVTYDILYYTLPPKRFSRESNLKGVLKSWQTHGVSNQH
jgi:hypothetical protein